MPQPMHTCSALRPRYVPRPYTLQGAEGHHSVFIYYLSSCCTAGHIGLHGGHGFARHSRQRQAHEQQGEEAALLKQRMAPQLPIFAATREHHSEHAQRKEQIACIGEPCAPYVVAHGENSALLVAVERGLVEPISLHVERMVHRNHMSPALAPTRTNHVAFIVGWSHGAGVVHDTKTVEPQCERQLAGLFLPLLKKIVGTAALTQVERAFARADERHGSAQQNDKKRNMEQAHGYSLPHLPPQQHHNRHNGQRHPECEKPLCVVNVCGGKFGAVEPF